MAKAPSKNSPASKAPPVEQPVTEIETAPVAAEVVNEPASETPPVEQPVTEIETAPVVAEVVNEPAPEIDLGPDVTMVLLTSMGGVRAYVPGEDYSCSAAEGGRMRAAGIAKPKGDADAAAIDAYVAAILAGGEQA